MENEENKEQVPAVQGVEKETEILEISEETRVAILVSLSKLRALRAEGKVLDMQIRKIIKDIDLNGELAKALDEANLLSPKINVAESELTNILSAVQGTTGKDLSKYKIDPDTGNLIKDPS